MSVQNYSLTSIGCGFQTCREAAAVYCNGLVYVLSSRSNKRVDCYSVWQKVWFSKPELPRPRVDLAACASQGKIYVSGGALDCVETLDCCEYCESCLGLSRLSVRPWFFYFGRL